MSKILWIDTETTGLDCKIHGLREVGFIIEIDGEVKEKGLLYINTMTYKKEKYISKYVRDSMGVSEETLLQYPTSKNTYIAFENIVYKYVNSANTSKFQMAGFNIDFDYEFMKEWFEDVYRSENMFNTYFGYQKLDVLSLVRNLKYFKCFETQNNKLETLCKHFNIPIDAHEALSDIVATKQLNDLLGDKYILKFPTSQSPQ